MVQTKEERFYFYAVMIAFGIVAFSVATFMQEPTITGFVTYPDYEEIIPQIHELLDDFIMTEYIADDANICIEIVMEKDEAGNEKSFSYDVRKENGTIIVNESRYSLYCNGLREEDFIIKFPSYKKFQELKNDPSCDKFVKGGDGKYFYYIPSKLMNIGGIGECNERFQEIYCPALYACIDEVHIALAKLRCCLPPTSTSELQETTTKDAVIDIIAWGPSLIGELIS